MGIISKDEILYISVLKKESYGDRKQINSLQGLGLQGVVYKVAFIGAIELCYIFILVVVHNYIHLSKCTELCSGKLVLLYLNLNES